MSGLHNLEFCFRQALVRQRVAAFKQQRPGWRVDPVLRRDILWATLRSWPNLAIVAIILSGEIGLLAGFNLSGSLAVALIGGGALLGLLLETGLVWFSLHDEARFDRALAKRLQPTVTFNLATIRDKRLKAKLVKALRDWGQIDEMVSRASPRAWSEQLLNTNRRVMRWVESLYALAGQIDRLRLALAKRANLRGELIPVGPGGESFAWEANAIQQSGQIRQTLQHTLQQAETHLDQTLAALELVHLQVVLIVHKGGPVVRIEDMQRDVNEAIAGLQDLTEALDEVFATIASL